MATRKPKAAQTGRSADLGETIDLGETPDIPVTPDLGTTPNLARRGPMRFAAGGDTGGGGNGGASGNDIVALARPHIGETYVFGARAPMGNPHWRGPWDCAEFVSWCVFQASGVLYGTEPQDDPMLADAFTGFWAQQAQAGGHLMGVQEAAGIAGAAVLRKPRPGAIGHIVISDGRGGTVEAHSRARGVIAGTLAGRRWDAGVLVPGIRYLRAQTPVTLGPTPQVLRLTLPLTQGPGVLAVQRRLQALGFAPGSADGIYGPQTAHAVRQFQAHKGLVPDGEVGQVTREALLEG